MSLRACVALAAFAAVTSCTRAPPACPASFHELPESVKEAGGECSCPLGQGSGSVWGGPLYTEDSSVCRAAVHAGVVDPAKGGSVKFKGAPGCPKYKGSQQHGVQSAAWGAYPKSFGFPAAGAAACAPGVENECPGRYADATEAQKAGPFSCSCDEVAGGSVWGSGIYTSDSAICAAAVHAGATKPAGGKVTVRPAPGCQKYEAAEKNGVASAAWGPFDSSFYFEDFGSGACPEVPADACPGSFQDVPGHQTAKAFSCTCTADPTGSVWGTGVYTGDSSLCGAAIHAGAIGAQGGKITVSAFKGCNRYVGSERNGITTGDWGAFPSGSFVIDGKGRPECAK
ncbi:MAG: hypothetical protein IPJ65_12640 [Archangiaceae bacterium]|nr:hypothetical protein [Archangiaceae bacterium]